MAHTAPAVPDTPPAAPEDTHTPAGAADHTHHTAAAAAGSDTVAARGGHIAAAAGGNLAVAGGSLAAARSSGVVRSLAAAGRKVELGCMIGYFAGRRLGWRRGGTRLVRRRRRRWRRGAFLGSAAITLVCPLASVVCLPKGEGSGRREGRPSSSRRIRSRNLEGVSEESRRKHGLGVWLTGGTIDELADFGVAVKPSEELSGAFVLADLGELEGDGAGTVS